MLDEHPQPVLGEAWVDSPTDIDVIEHATASDEHGTVLSIRWMPESSAVALTR
jgi:hypothetical protein